MGSEHKHALCFHCWCTSTEQSPARLKRPVSHARQDHAFFISMHIHAITRIVSRRVAGEGDVDCCAAQS